MSNSEISEVKNEIKQISINLKSLIDRIENIKIDTEQTEEKKINLEADKTKTENKKPAGSLKFIKNNTNIHWEKSLRSVFF